jgi:hypothetical protein
MSQQKVTAKGGQKGRAEGAQTKRAQPEARANKQQPGDLAELIKAVLEHPDTPADIYNDLQDALHSSPHYGKAHKTVEFIRVLLDSGRPTESGERADALTQRAQAIINDTKRYNAATRSSAALALEKDDPKTLAEVVGLIESGEWDEEEESPARREARRLLIHRKELPSFNYQHITPSQAQALTDQIIQQDEDEQAHAFITLLNGLIAAHYAELAELRGEGSEHFDMEGLAREAANRAYSKTFHFNDGATEFTMLDADVFREMDDDKLREEIWGKEGDA